MILFFGGPCEIVRVTDHNIHGPVEVEVRMLPGEGDAGTLHRVHIGYLRADGGINEIMAAIFHDRHVCATCKIPYKDHWNTTDHTFIGVTL